MMKSEAVRRQIIALLLVALIGVSGCGKKTRPVPPDTVLPAPITDLSYQLDEKGVTLAGGQGELTGKIVRIAHMGSITREDLECGIQILKETIQELSGKK